MRKKSSDRQAPGQLGVAAATVAMVAIVVGLAQIPGGGAWTTAGGSVPLTPPAAEGTTAQTPSASVPGSPQDSPSLSAGATPTGPAPASADPAGTTHGQAGTQPAPTAGQPPGGQPPSSGATPSAAPPAEPAPQAAPPPSAGPTGSAPTGAAPTGAAPDASTVQRVTDSCSRRLQSDASNSGIVSGTVVPRPYLLVSVEYVGIPHRSTAGPGLESYDVELSVTTQPSDGPARTDRRVCRVYDYDSHVDWLPAG